MTKKTASPSITISVAEDGQVSIDSDLPLPEVVLWLEISKLEILASLKETT